MKSSSAQNTAAAGLRQRPRGSTLPAPPPPPGDAIPPGNATPLLNVETFNNGVCPTRAAGAGGEDTGRRAARAVTDAPKERLVAARAAVQAARSARRRDDESRDNGAHPLGSPPRKARKLAAKTIAVYKGHSTRLLMAVQRECRRGSDIEAAIRKVLAPYAGSRQTFTAYRSALNWGLRKLRDRLLARQDHAWDAGNQGLFYRSVDRLNNVSSALELLPSIDRVVLKEEHGISHKKAETAKQTLKLLPGNWREEIMDCFEPGSRHRQIVEFFRLTGCRPEELKNMIVLSKVQLGYEVHIHGAKVTEEAGQPIRSFVIEAIPAVIAKEMNRGGLLFIATDAELNQVRAKLVRYSRKLWPQLGRRAVSPYVFRHQLAQDLADAGWPPQDLSLFLGHAQEDTATWYCRRRPRRVRPRVNIVTGSAKGERTVRAGNTVGFTAEKLNQRQSAADGRKQTRRRPRAGS